MHPRLLVVSVLVTACGGRAPSEVPPPEAAEPVEAPEPAPVAAPGAPITKGPPDVPSGSDGSISIGLSQKAPHVGDVVTVTFSRPGPNGCYRQSEPETRIDGTSIVHRYTTATEGEMCSQALVPGGFVAELVPDRVGNWDGTVIVDDEAVANYVLEVAP